MTERKPFAIYAITKHGLDIAADLYPQLEGADLYVSSKFMEKAPEGALGLPLPFSPVLKELFPAYDAHIFIISVGAVVRMIAPLLESKKVDPAVICVDDARRFSISLLSGHVGRGNEYAHLVASSLGIMPIITTASDSIGTLTVDILGRELGWVLDDMDRNVTRGCAAVVNEEKVAFIQECGEAGFWPLDKPLPKGVSYYEGPEGLKGEDFGIVLWVTDRVLEKGSLWHNAVIYRPKSLVVGIGCDKGTPYGLLKAGLLAQFEQAGLSVKSIKALATIDIKKKEPGLLELAKDLNVPLYSETAEVLDKVSGIENPSATVRRYVGCSSVAEASCLYFSGAKKLLLAKQKYTQEGAGKNMTLAIGRVLHKKREVSFGG